LHEAALLAAIIAIDIPTVCMGMGTNQFQQLGEESIFIPY
jgi:hypothetical protein